MPVKIFFCYAHEDEALLGKIKTHLIVLQRQKPIDIWYDRDISAGTEWAKEIDIHLKEAKIILLLISPDFLASDYCCNIMKRAIEKRELEEALVIPVILRPVDWKDMPFSKLQVLPTNTKAVTSWSKSKRDEAFLDIAKGIRKAAEGLTRDQLPEVPQTPAIQTANFPQQPQMETNPDQSPQPGPSEEEIDPGTPPAQTPSTKPLEERDGISTDGGSNRNPLGNCYKWRRLGVIAVIILVVLFLFSAINGGLHPPVTPPPAAVGICDGNCVVDPYRLDNHLKQEAATAFNQNKQGIGCQYLRWAAIGNIQGAEQVGKDDSWLRSVALDSTDAEAKIYYADRCTNIPCPSNCISYVAVVQMIYPEDPQYGNNSDYINGVGRGILQGAYVKQNEWNASHPNGPGMYIFVANIVAGDPNQAYAQQTQEEVAQQIIQHQQADHILGVFGLPLGSSYLTSELNNAHIPIPMVSTTPMSADDARQGSYLFSVVPSLQTEIQDILDYCKKSDFSNIQYYYSDYYSDTLFNNIWENIINSDQKYALLKGKIHSYPYYNPLKPSGESIPKRAALSGADLIIFIGPMNDTVNFLTELRKEEAQDHISEQKVLSDDNAYQWVYKYFSPEERASRAAFDQFYFVSFAYPDPRPDLSPNEQSMLNDFTSLFDPTSKHSGNIYTHHRASSDALLAYDALSVLVTAEDKLSHTFPRSLDTRSLEDREKKLQQYISQNTFLGVSGQITYNNNNRNVPDQKIVLLISVVQQKNAVLQILSGQYEGKGK